MSDLHQHIDTIKTELRSSIVTVVFTKKNGEQRVMDCTLNLQLIPPSKWPKGKIELSEETQLKTIRVYDVNACDWRSFLIDNVVEINVKQ